MNRSSSSSTLDGGEQSAFPTHVTDSSAFRSDVKGDREKSYLKRPLSKKPSPNFSSDALSTILHAAAFVDFDTPKECFSPLPSSVSPSGLTPKQEILSHSTPSTPYRVRNEDGYLEHFSREDLIRVIALHIDRLTRCDLSAPHRSNPLSVFFSVSLPPISILGYIRRIVTRTHCSPSVFIVALIYLERIAHRHDELALSHFNLHRLFIAAVTLAVKKLDDHTFSNAYYAKVGALPSREVLIHLEVAFMQHVDYDLHVTYPPYVEMINRLDALLTSVRENNADVLGMSLIPYSTSPVKRTGKRMSTRLEHKSQSERSALTSSSIQRQNHNGKKRTITERNAISQRSGFPSSSSPSSGEKRRRIDATDNEDDQQPSDDGDGHDDRSNGGPNILSTQRIKPA